VLTCTTPRSCCSLAAAIWLMTSATRLLRARCARAGRARRC
jgi:hypothetical protein